MRSGNGGATTPRGWKALLNARKHHYFIGMRSVCGKYMTFGTGGCVDNPRLDSSPDNCRACAKRVQEMRAKEARA